MHWTHRSLIVVVGCCAVGLFLAAGYAQAPGKQATKEEIARLFDQWNAALQTGKADEVANLYAPNAILLPTISDKVRRNRAEIKEYFERFLQSKPFGKIDEQHIRIHGDLALNSGTYTFTLTKGGKKSDVQARYTFVYHRQGDRWLIVDHHSSEMPESRK